MKGKLSQSVLLAAALLLAGCSKPQPEPASPQKPAEIKGQVLVIQKNRVNVKLGGVDVRYMPREAFEKRCRWIQDSLPKIAQVAGYEQDLQHIDAVLKESSAGKGAGKIRNFLATAKEHQLDAWKQFEENADLEAYRRTLSHSELSRQSFDEAGFGRNEEDQWALSAFFFDFIYGDEVISTQTDADGNYSLSVPAPADGYVFARSSRELGRDESESYYWIEEVLPSTAGPVHLSTNSHLSRSTLRDFVGPSSEPATRSMNDFVKEYKLPDLSWFAEAETLLRKIEENEDSASKLKSRVEEVEVEMEKTMYMDMGTD
jgi:hypothetical protein